jgi:hypothetical protein
MNRIMNTFINKTWKTKVGGGYTPPWYHLLFEGDPFLSVWVSLTHKVPKFKAAL